eukprot:Rmarinus@m.12952
MPSILSTRPRCSPSHTGLSPPLEAEVPLWTAQKRPWGTVGRKTGGAPMALSVRIMRAMGRNVKQKKKGGRRTQGSRTANKGETAVMRKENGEKVAMTGTEAEIGRENGVRIGTEIWIGAAEIVTVTVTVNGIVTVVTVTVTV